MPHQTGSWCVGASYELELLEPHLHAGLTCHKLRIRDGKGLTMLHSQLLAVPGLRHRSSDLVFVYSQAGCVLQTNGKCVLGQLERKENWCL